MQVGANARITRSYNAGRTASARAHRSVNTARKCVLPRRLGKFTGVNEKFTGVQRARSSASNGRRRLLFFALGALRLARAETRSTLSDAGRADATESIILRAASTR